MDKLSIFRHKLSALLLVYCVLLLASPIVSAQTTDSTPSPENTETPVEPAEGSTTTPTLTPTLTLTPTATPVCDDTYEPNEQLASGPVLMSNQPISDLTLAPSGDIDYFQVWVKAGYHYQVDTATVDGVDTRIRLFNDAGDLLSENDDYITGNPASRIKFQSSIDGWLFIAVDSLIPIEWGCRKYNISITDYTPPTPTPTLTPEPTSTVTSAPTQTPAATNTPLPELYDAYEPNYDFDSATNIGVGQVIELNFHTFPPGDSGIDNDFFRLYVKTEQNLLIETQDLAGGVDTNLILYREDRSVIDGNDDCELGKLYSCLSWFPDYTGIAYLLVGPVGVTPKSVSDAMLNYRLSVVDLAGAPTITPPPGYGTDAPWPQTPTDPTEEPTKEPTPTKEPQVDITTFSLAPPTPTPLPSQPVVVEVTIYYDENDNKAPDINEGITGVNMQVLDGLSNRLIGQTFTNGQGHASIFTSTAQKVRVTIPYLGYSQTIGPPGKQFEIRVSPLQLPSLIP